MEKKTKATILTAVAKYFTENEITVDGVTSADIIAYANTTIEQMENKKAKAREKAAEKKLEGDEAENRILEILTNELQTGDDITKLLNDNELTKSKVIARLTNLCNKGTVVKESIKIGKSNKMAYKLV